MKPQGHRYVIGVLDLDNFKRINDTLGHGRGDELLKVVASVIKERFSSADIIARVGGDEIAVVFIGMSPNEVVGALSNLVAVLPAHTRAAGFPELTASGGVSSDRIEPFDNKLRAADEALYQAKAGGNARIELARSFQH